MRASHKFMQLAALGMLFNGVEAQQQQKILDIKGAIQGFNYSGKGSSKASNLSRNEKQERKAKNKQQRNSRKANR